MPNSTTDRRVVDHSGGVVHVAQLTDTHLGREPGSTLLSMDTDRSLQAVVDLVRSRARPVDLVLGTGDLADGGTLNAYQRLHGYFSQLSDNCFCLPGNHDDRQLMVEALGAFPWLAAEVRIANWQVLLLDSQVPGQVGGTLGAAELERLGHCLDLARTEGLFTLVCLHHHPVPIGSGWLDEQIVTDREQFFSTLDRFSGVRGVLWGHVHQEIDRERNGVRLMASPSTCVQFAPGSEHFRADDRAPGYRWLELHPDGRIATGVERVEGMHFEVDLESDGYLD